MEWLGWVFPVIVIAGWILKQLANQAENKPPERRVPRETSKRPPEEIRKFLEEMRRQRTEARGEAPEPEPTAQVVKPPPVTRSLPPRPLPKPAKVRMDIPPRPRPELRREFGDSKRAPLVMEAVLVPVAAPPAASLASAQVGDGATSPTTSVQRTTSKAAKQLLQLLGDRRNLGAAFLLREVLDRPVSQRRRRGVR